MKKYVLMAAALLAFGLASAQTSNEIVTKYNEGAAAMQAKDFAKAAALLEQVVVEGMDSEDNTVLNCVQTSKKYIPNCYYRLGGNAIKAGNYDEALANFSKSAEKAELYGDSQAKMKANAWVAKVYLVQGGEAFNNKDYATAAEVFAKGYAANPRNTEMALNLAMSYCESGEYEKGMEIYRNICNMPADKYAEAIAKAKENMALYTNNEVAKMQAAGDNDGIIAMADNMLAADPASALAEKIRIQAYNNKKDYAKVIELGETAAAAQTDEDDRSDVYFILGAAYNAKEMKEQAIANLKKLPPGNWAEAPHRALAYLPNISVIADFPKTPAANSAADFFVVFLCVKVFKVLKDFKDYASGTYFSTLNIIFLMCPSPSIGAWASSGIRMVNCPSFMV